MQFAGIEQQLKSNEQLKSLVEIEKSAQATQALVYVGNNGRRRRQQGAVRQIGDLEFSVRERHQRDDHDHQFGGTDRLYRQSYRLKQGNSSFVWDGKGNDGVQWPAGTYTLTATGKDSSGNNVAISTEVQGIVDSVDLTRLPAAAVDRRPELHHRQDQARGPSSTST